MVPEVEPDFWRGKAIDEMNSFQLREALRQACVHLARERNENSRLMQHLCQLTKTADIVWLDQPAIWLVLLASFCLGVVIGSFL